MNAMTVANTLDWGSLHHRLRAAQSAVESKLAPGHEETQRILRTRARLLSTGGTQDTTSPQASLEVVEFVLGSEHYGIATHCIREIHTLHEFTPLPCTPAFVLGLFNVRGQIRSIINLKKLFDLPEMGLTDLNKIILVHSHPMEIGILADAILGVRVISQQALHPPLPTMTGIGAKYLKGITKDSLVVLDVDTILADKNLVVDEVVSNAP